MNISKESSMDQIKLTLSGELTIAHAVELKAAIREALDMTARVIVDLRSATGMDLSVLQLLCSAHRSAIGSGKRFELKGEDVPPLPEIRRAAGFARHRGCDFNPNENCLWVKGEADGKKNYNRR